MFTRLRVGAVMGNHIRGHGLPFRDAARSRSKPRARRVRRHATRIGKPALRVPFAVPGGGVPRASLLRVRVSATGPAVNSGGRPGCPGSPGSLPWSPRGGRGRLLAGRSRSRGCGSYIRRWSRQRVVHQVQDAGWGAFMIVSRRGQYLSRTAHDHGIGFQPSPLGGQAGWSDVPQLATSALTEAMISVRPALASEKNMPVFGSMYSSLSMPA
jgi:hypothetical protein